MPELPEVENVRRGIVDQLNLRQGPRRLAKIELRRADLRYPIPEKVLGAQGQFLIDVKRRAKYLLFEFKDFTLLSHLGMSGRWGHSPGGIHDHIVLHFEGAQSLIYNDPRRFGCFDYLPAGAQSWLLANLGPEPWMSRSEKNLVVANLTKGSRAIKQVLMDAKVLVGVGNIYASEVLFRSQINPFLPAKSVTTTMAENLLVQVVKVLDEAIRRGGTTLKDHKLVDGKVGQFQKRLQVYGRQGLPCRTCGKKILAQPLSGRMTYWCSHCQ